MTLTEPQPVPGSTDWTSRPWSDVSSRTMVVDGIAHNSGTVRALVRERYGLATDLRNLTEENVQLRLRVERLLATQRQQQTHLHRRTAALVRLIAASRPGLDAEGASPIAKKGPRL